MLKRREAARLALRIHDRLDPVAAEWRRLEGHPLVSPHQGLDWVHAWADTHRNPLRIVEILLDGMPGLILPLEIVERKMVRIARFVAADHSNINTGLFSEALVRALNPYLIAAIADQIRRVQIDADLISLTNVPKIWRGTVNPLSGIEGQENPNHTFQLPLLETFEATLDQINGKKRRKNFRAGERRFDAWGGYAYVTAVTAEEQRTLLNEFFRLRAQRFAEQGLPDCFREAETKAFFHRLAAISARPKDDPLRMHAIRRLDNGACSAIAGVTVKGCHAICQFTTIGDGPERAASPGEMLFFKMIEAYQADGLRLFDFGMGSNRLKESWTAQETVQYDLAVPLTAIGRLAALKDEATLKAKSIVKQNPALYAFIQRLRARSQGDATAPDDERD